MFLTLKQEIPAALVMLVVAIAIVNTAVEICPESRCPGPLPQMQQIVEGDRVIEYFFNSSLYITNINWCINGKQATNPTLFREKIMKNFSTNVLVYTNPSREDRANGLTLYAIEGESHSDCAINTNLITVQSNVGNISARLVLIHIVEASCPVLHHPVNGKVVHVTDKTANYSCNPGFNLNGNSTITCVTKVDEQVGEWIGSSPTCEPVTCERPTITNGTVDFCGDGQEPNRTSFGAIATFKCDEGYTLSDSTTLRCTYGISTENSLSENGNWNSTLPTCEALPPTTTASTTTTTPSTTSITLHYTTSISVPPVPGSIKIEDPRGISIVLTAFIVGLVLGVLATSVVCYVCVKRTSTIHPATCIGNLNRNDVLNGHIDYQMDGIEDSQKQDS
ncbi:sushi, von Willebrand factor type A, EGF and pentraxin domain-containing protein 1-like [Halichondria panicea]|uniref:sushi, von Willebrand factor type A, EGF and pentraxin domain-containing protein 1-like n=1 Tax=Halichondria panicea TaxID=6063 RepID=UPI00312B794C